MDKSKILKSLYIIIPIILVAALGSVFVYLGMPWYIALAKPSQWVPNILIPIVWSVIYITFGVIIVLMQNKYTFTNYLKAMLIINGLLNVLWCLLFFTLKLTLVGDIAIILNVIAGFALVLEILQDNKLYGYILFIYPIWLSIATTLNIAMWVLN